MRELYKKPLRIYLIAFALACWGIYSGLNLPISLFPQSDQATLSVTVPYEEQTAVQFFESMGQSLEYKLASTLVENQQPESVFAKYQDQSVRYLIKFPWGAPGEECRKAIETTILTATANLSENVRRQIHVGMWKENAGFYAASFYSKKRSLDDLYKFLNPSLNQLTSKIPDSSGVGLYNPNSKEIRVDINIEKLAIFNITISQIEKAISYSLSSLNGGEIRLGEKNYQMIIPKNITSIEDLKNIKLSENQYRTILLKDVAEINLTPSENIRQKFRTSGAESLILFADPKENGNIKKMADDMTEQIKQLSPQWPEDIEFKVLVNPSEFINSSVKNVVKEVVLAAILAVFVLFLFIGSLKNVMTAAIEIPMSLVLAFILMKLTNMNLNLISLSGLALSAGMNVDASVVVMENIFRYFEIFPGKKTLDEKLDLIIKAVNEVKAPVISSTIASLVVFSPLILTKGLTNSLLGDLAKAVVFSHGLSVIVALILVPTIRLQFLKNESNSHFKSPIEKQFSFIENSYIKALKFYLEKKWVQYSTVISIGLVLVFLIQFILPKLDKEVIGKPETDWLMVGFNSSSLNSTKQVDSELEILEADLLKRFEKEAQYTFSQVFSNNGGVVMMKLGSSKQLESLKKIAEETYTNSTDLSYWIDAWNPSELEIPNPPSFKVEISGGNSQSRMDLSNDLSNDINEMLNKPRIRIEPSVNNAKSIKISPYLASDAIFNRYELTHYLKTLTVGTWVSNVSIDDNSLPIYLRADKSRTSSIEQVKAIPINAQNKILPLSSVARFEYASSEPPLYRENSKSISVLTGRISDQDKAKLLEIRNKIKQLIENKNKELSKKTPIDTTRLNMLNADLELDSALDQIKWAIIISIILIFITMVIQFGDIIHALLVLVAIPVGFIGVLISLFVFKSTLSLNSGLGTILLNGIAVANSIILVDFMKKLFEQGMEPKEAALVSAKARFRPILMTSLTTALGMLPIAFGFGEGGKILQPLGIAVTGGLWFSMIFTLFLVPSLQYLYLSSKEPKLNKSKFNYNNQKVMIANQDAKTKTSDDEMIEV